MYLIPLYIHRNLYCYSDRWKKKKTILFSFYRKVPITHIAEHNTLNVLSQNFLYLVPVTTTNHFRSLYMTLCFLFRSRVDFVKHDFNSDDDGNKMNSHQPFVVTDSVVKIIMIYYIVECDDEPCVLFWNLRRRQKPSHLFKTYLFQRGNWHNVIWNRQYYL